MAKGALAREGGEPMVNWGQSISASYEYPFLVRVGGLRALGYGGWDQTRGEVYG